jgi:1-acyl-sn-glycerol-3-phosphate acyltransferase
MLRGPDQRIVGIDVAGLDRVAALLRRGDGVLLASNHPGRADGLVLLHLADLLGVPFCVMAAQQLFCEGAAAPRRWLFPRLGVFPVDREGADRAALAAAVDVLTAGDHPLLIFPEGEVYYLADRLTPLREGVARIALAGARKRAEAGRTVWIVPIALKYRFPEGLDPRPALLRKMADLEVGLTWRPRPDLPLVERIYRFAEALLSLKEAEHLGASRSGPLPARIAGLGAHLLATIEAAHGVAARADETVPERVKALRRLCLNALKNPGTPPEARQRAHDQLDDLFVVIQAFSYPGDYIVECPTLERVAETLTKLDEDLLLLSGRRASPPAPLRAVVHVGEPIDVGAATASAGASRPRDAAAALTAELERRLQAALDAIGPGRPFVDPTPAPPPTPAPKSRAPWRRAPGRSPTP